MGRKYKNQNPNASGGTMLDEEELDDVTQASEGGVEANADLSPETPPARVAAAAGPDVPSGDVAADAPRARQGSDGRPFCPKHLCLLTANKSTAASTHYACPVPGCDSKEKRARPLIPIPREPQHCPQRTCAGNPRAILEVAPKQGHRAHIKMVCPVCNFHMHQPRPEMKAVFVRDREREKRAAADDDIGAR